MIFTVPTKYMAGVTLWGDYHDLKDLHETIHDLAPEESILSAGMQEYVMGLAYEVRKAYEKQREQKKFGFDDYDTVVYRGSKLIWPQVLFQVSVLRTCAAFRPNNRKHQANLYRLEACLEESLFDADKSIAQECMFFLDSPFPIIKDYYVEFIALMTRRYLEGPGGKVRLKKLPAILRSILAISDEYRDFAKFLENKAKEQGCSPHSLSIDDQFDFKW